MFIHIGSYCLELMYSHRQQSRSQEQGCNFPLYKKADWDQLKQSMSDVHSELKHSDPATTNVQNMCDKFATRLEQGIDKFTTTRKTGTRDGFPWINKWHFPYITL